MSHFLLYVMELVTCKAPILIEVNDPTVVEGLSFHTICDKYTAHPLKLEESHGISGMCRRASVHSHVVSTDSGMLPI